MAALNYKHLHYFWAVVKSGGVARAGERPHLTPQSISGQLRLLEEAVGEKLFRRSGRKLELTEAGRLVADYAKEIFALGEELQGVLRHKPTDRPAIFRVGVAEMVPKSVAYRLLEPAMHLTHPVRIICREDRMDNLLGELAVHRLDLVIADRPMSSNMNVRGFNHLLGKCGITFLATAALAKAHRGAFPARLNGAPMLLPGEDVAMRPQLMRWLEERKIAPRIVGEFDDSALMKAFGQGGAGVFAVPTVIARQVCLQYSVMKLGATDEVTEEIYAISAERRISHPAVVAISEAAKREMYGRTK